ncbi:4-hydroxy-tetrahydrodipicolinate synthase [Geothrix limicola]|uniref:4-hydroxy-tetrahydrodipicolinate synthase n=1 Tax=Geothrix limicola TaxID=2927978 RepID=A0ABQ5QEG1_9BACT|nr:4-hydroxy-tetrahydrodipicolinate synthase [Geothrix limicola]GLH73224.1 4-hydroxy-tetrahydrodipicolinate synthase [Geothrix limicola]
MTLDLSGLAVALATPFTSAGDLDLPAFRKLVRHVVGGGVDTLVPLGTTGEASTLLDAERDAIITACLEESQGRTVIVGTGSNATRQAAALTRRAQELGAAGALVVTPYYNKPNPDGLVAHYAAIAEAAPGFPLVAYNVPGRTGQNVVPALLMRLWENPQVVAVKESSGSLSQIAEVARTLPKGKTLLSGDDNLALASMAVGASGLVSVLGNVLPRETSALVAAARGGNGAEALRLHQQLLPLMDALFVESNPVPLKAALKLLGLGTDVVRLPLAQASAATRTLLSEALCLASDGTLPGVM